MFGAIVAALAVACAGGSPSAPGSPTPNASATAPAALNAPRTIVIDPGHGGEEIGAAHHDPATGAVLREKDSNLDMALRLQRLLDERGYRVVLTRESDSRATPLVQERPLAGPAYAPTRADLQARVDIANAAGADLFISIHSNGSSSATESGVEVWQSSTRPFAQENRRLAELALERVLAELRSWGYPAVDRGLKDSACFRSRGGRCFELFVLGAEREWRLGDLRAFTIDPSTLGVAPGDDPNHVLGRTRATQSPGVLVELLFLSNDADADVLRDDTAREAMARGLADAIDAFFGSGSVEGARGLPGA